MDSFRRALRGLVPLVKGLTVLVVDDDEAVRESTRLLLEDLGARVLTAPNGACALDLIQAETADLVLSDLIMPGVDGYHLVERVRNDGQQETLPVIAVSATASLAEREHTRRVGFDAHLGKPFDYADLYEALRIVMRRQPRLYARQLKGLRSNAEQERNKAHESRQRAKLAREKARGFRQRAKPVLGRIRRAMLAGRLSCRCQASFVEPVWRCAECGGRCCPECAFLSDGCLYCRTCADRLAA
jgi:CheY-like chemotaxis protein